MGASPAVTTTTGTTTPTSLATGTGIATPSGGAAATPTHTASGAGGGTGGTGVTHGLDDRRWQTDGRMTWGDDVVDPTSVTRPDGGMEFDDPEDPA